MSSPSPPQSTTTSTTTTTNRKRKAPNENENENNDSNDSSIENLTSQNIFSSLETNNSGEGEAFEIEQANERIKRRKEKKRVKKQMKKAMKGEEQQQQQSQSSQSQQTQTQSKQVEQTEQQDQQQQQLPKIVELTSSSSTPAPAKLEVVLKLEAFFAKNKFQSVKLRDVQNLIFWLLADGMNPEWIFVKNMYLVKQVVVLMLAGLGNEFAESKEKGMEGVYFQSLCRLGTQVVPIQAPGTNNRIFSPLPAILNSPVQKQKKQNKPAVVEPLDMTKLGEIAESFLLTPEELVENKYPIPSASASPGFDSFESTTPETFNPLLAIDCEMCRTCEGLELTRISVVNHQLEVLYDEYVKPDNPIIDYLTRFSGVTQEILDPVTKKLKDVQEDLKKIISKNSILVGHSLENDLIALKMYHDKIIDTAILYPHFRGPPAKNALKNLAEKFLQFIMHKSAQGHDSAQDATIAMRLCLLKMQQGKNFAVEKIDNSEPIFNRLDNFQKKAAMIDRQTLLRQYSTSSVASFPCGTDKEVLEKTLCAIKGPYQFVWAQFLDLLSCHRDKAKTEVTKTTTESTATTTTTESTTTTTATTTEANGTNESEILNFYDHCIQKIYQEAAPNTFFIILTGTGDTSTVNKLIEKKSRGAWMLPDEALLVKEIEKARKGCGFFCVND